VTKAVCVGAPHSVSCACAKQAQRPWRFISEKILHSTRMLNRSAARVGPRNRTWTPQCSQHVSLLPPAGCRHGQTHEYGYTYATQKRSMLVTRSNPLAPGVYVVVTCAHVTRAMSSTVGCGRSTAQLLGGGVCERDRDDHDGGGDLDDSVPATALVALDSVPAAVSDAEPPPAAPRHHGRRAL
jgi:hypothetical protein